MEQFCWSVPARRETAGSGIHPRVSQILKCFLKTSTFAILMLPRYPTKKKLLLPHFRKKWGRWIARAADCSLPYSPLGSLWQRRCLGACFASLGPALAIGLVSLMKPTHLCSTKHPYQRTSVWSSKISSPISTRSTANYLKISLTPPNSSPTSSLNHYFKTYFSIIISSSKNRWPVCRISVQGFHMYYSSADIFSHTLACMDRQLLHSILKQRIKESLISKKKEEYAKKFSMWSYSCSFLHSVQKEPVVVYCRRYWSGWTCSRFALDTNTQDVIRHSAGPSLPHGDKCSQYRSSRTGKLYSPTPGSSVKSLCRQQQEKEAITQPRSGLMFLPPASPYPPNSFCFILHWTWAPQTPRIISLISERSLSRHISISFNTTSPSQPGL